MRRIGHRGAKGHVAENTIASFEKALALGCDGLELDVHLSGDGVPIVFHDETLARLCNVDGRIQDMTLSEIRSLRVKNEFPIPTLEEVLRWLNGRAWLNIEIKTADCTDSVVALLKAELALGRSASEFLISSFDLSCLKDFWEKLPEIPIGVLTETNLDLAVAFAKTIGAEAIHPHFLLLTSENTSAIKADGFAVNPWTVNVREDIARLQSWKVDGIITDYPERLIPQPS